MIRKENDGNAPSWIGVIKDWRAQSYDPLPFLVSLEPQQLRTHALLIGSTGSGKTTLLQTLTAQDIERGHSIAVLDLRGDFADAVCRLCAGRVPPSDVKFLDLREKERPLGYDPLYGPGEPYFRALGVLDTVEKESDSWGVQLADTLRNALMLLAEAGERMTMLERLFYDRSFRAACLNRVEPSPVTEFWVRFEMRNSPERQQALAMPVLNKVSLLMATKTLRKVLGHPNPLDLSDHLNRPGTVTLASLATDELHQAARMLGNLFLESICREMLSRVRTPELMRNPVRIYVDEFEHFVGPTFETVLAEGRRFGLSLVLAHQTLAQLTPRLRSMILNNAGVKVCFRCGREDAATLLKDITGDTKAVDLTSFDTGEAFMWVRGHGTGVIEVNEPIPVARLGSAHTERFLQAVRALNGDPGYESPWSTHENTVPHSPPRASGGSMARLEDWLQ